MRELTTNEMSQCWKLAREFQGSGIEDEKTKIISQALLELCAENVEELKEWQINPAVHYKQLNKLIHEVNKLSDRLLAVEEKLLSTGNALNLDFDRAEKEADHAIHLASGDPKKFDDYQKAVAAYYQSDEAENIIAAKKRGEVAEHPQHIQSMEVYMKKGKDLVNAMANGLMVYNPQFRAERESYIKQYLQKEYNAQFADRDGQIQFRAVRPFGDYGLPETAFQEGLAPQFVSVWSFQRGIISKPYINDASATTGEKVGWTGGITSTSSNLKFVSAFDFAASYGQQEGWIYSYATDEAASVAHHITYGCGYDGIVNTKEGIDRSNAEAAMEYMVKFMAPENIVAARKISKNGDLGEIKFNPNAQKSAFGDAEYLKFLFCESVNEIRCLEFLENRSPEIKDGHEASVYADSMINIFESLAAPRQAWLLKLAYAANQALSDRVLAYLEGGTLENDPEKWNHLKDLVDNANAHIKQTVSGLSRETLTQIESEKESALIVPSHFPSEFEADKRVEAKMKPVQPIVVQHRYQLGQADQPQHKAEELNAEIPLGPEANAGSDLSEEAPEGPLSRPSSPVPSSEKKHKS